MATWAQAVLGWAFLILLMFAGELLFIWGMWRFMDWFSDRLERIFR